MKRSNRKTAVLSAVLCFVLAVLMVLPMGATVSAAEGDDTVMGLGFSDSAFVSDWAGQKITTAGYGAWASNEGQYNGAFMWSNNYDKVLTGSDGKLPADGTITFRDANDLALKFYPGQISNNSLKAGPAYISFEFYYTPGSYKNADGDEKYYFPGVKFAAFENNNDQVIFSVDEKTGKVYVGNTPYYAVLQPTQYPEIGQFKEGWNTVEMVFMPMSGDGKDNTYGNVVTTANGVTYSKDTVKDGTWPVKTQFLYIRTSHESEPAGETYGFTQAELDANFTRYKFGNLRFYGGGGQGAGTMGEISSLKPIQNKAGDFKIGSAKAVNLEPDTELYEVTYEGHPELMQHVKKDGADNAIFAIPAKGTGEVFVEMWKSVNDDGSFAFYQPAVASRPGEPSNADNRMLVTKSLHLSQATGAELQIGKLGQVMDKINPDLTVYTFVELRNYITELETTASASGLTDDHDYIIRKNQIVMDLESRCGDIAFATENLILQYAAVFTDTIVALETRAEAFMEAYNSIENCDATYFNDDMGITAEMSAQALKDYNTFRISWSDIEASWNTYRTGLEELISANPGMDMASRYFDIITSYDIIRKTFTTFQLDDSIKMGYEDNLTAMKTEFDMKGSILEMYEYLSEWADNWNEYKTIVYGKNKKMELPAALKAAVDKYNNTVTTINNEIYEAASIVISYSNDITLNDETALVLLADIRSKINSKKNAALADK